MAIQTSFTEKVARNAASWRRDGQDAAGEPPFASR
jgi:hypothetical protein